jgi:hypothetical protein
MPLYRYSTPFSALFQIRTWLKAQILLIGAILSPGKRMVSSALCVMGLSHDVTFGKYHQVLNRASWSSLQLSRVLLWLLLDHLDSAKGPLVVGIDETLERRWGQQIKAKGIYRDGIRSSKSQFVKASGLRWISLMWLIPIPWAGRVWALPVLTALAPSERYYQQLGRRHKKLTDRARHMILQLRRWLPPGLRCWTASMLYWICCISASLWFTLSPSLPGCGWMRRCSSLPRPGTPDS